jgi:tetratricopeptide (TPR) repeat protein
MPRVYTYLRRLLPPLFLLWALALLPAARAKDSEPKWIRVSSTHFSVLTDAGEKKGREVVLRFEQMRGVFAQLMMKTRVNLSQPLEILALKTDEEYLRLAPVRQGRLISERGFFLAGADRDYVVLNLFEDESWRAVSHDFAHMLLNYNYPPTQAWFDEGFAEYFSSLRLTDQQVELGGDPELNRSGRQDIPRNQSEVRNQPKSLTDLLNQPVWIAMPDLFTMKAETSSYPEATHHTLFYAQSWMVMHYLLNQNKLSETGTYFDLVQNQKVPVEQAIQQAYGMSAAQFEQAVKDYIHSLAPSLLAQDKAQQPGSANPGNPLYQSPSSVQPGTIGTSTQKVSDSDGQALLAEMSLRLPEHRDQGLKELDDIVSKPKMENAIAHRALAWAHLEKKEFSQTMEELGRAMELDANDVWVRYYLALSKYRAAQSSGQLFHGLSNMMQDLQKVLDWDPDFAEAYSMLAMARVEGGGINSAMASMRTAILLSPRSEDYQLNMGLIYMQGKNWDAATALLERLKGSQNPQIAQAARKNLEDLPFLKKYGLLPQQAPTPQTTASPPQPIVPQRPSAPPKAVTTPAVTANEDEEERAQPPEPAPDKRPVQFIKGRLLSVDCASAPAALLTVTAGTKTVKLRTENYKSLLLIGVDEFSCAWTNRPVAVNYKAGGKTDGDLVSLELQ